MKSRIGGRVNARRFSGFGILRPEPQGPSWRSLGPYSASGGVPRARVARSWCLQLARRRLTLRASAASGWLRITTDLRVAGWRLAARPNCRINCAGNQPLDDRNGLAVTIQDPPTDPVTC